MGIADYDTILRWLHILSGITWIGMLYFFNFVNLPLLKFQVKKPYEANMAEKATAPVILKTLFYFRWGAFFTVLFGLLLVGSAMETMKDVGASPSDYFLDNPEGKMMGYAILMGVLFGLVMAFNVWFVIWPRQQKILANNKALAATTDEAEKKRLGDLNAPMVKEATLASRTNTWLSVPMLWGMVMGAHGNMANETFSDWAVPILVLLLVLAAMVIYSRAPPAKKTA